MVKIKKFKLVKRQKKLYFKKNRSNLSLMKFPKPYLNNIKLQTSYIDKTKMLINKSILSSIANTKVQIPKVPQISKDIRKAINNTTSLINENIQQYTNLMNKITSSIDLDKLKQIVESLQESLKKFIYYFETHKMSMKLEFFSDYYGVYVEKNQITDVDIYTNFKNHYSSIKYNLLNNDFYFPKSSYINLILSNFEKKRYVEASMLSLAVIDYLTIYNVYQEERESNYKSIKSVLNKDIEDNDKELERIITHTTIKLIKEYYSSYNKIKDPAYINRNRLMHGIMDIQSIKKIDCIKLLYILDVLSVIKVKLES
ncbi:hypothetical protein ACO1DJ_02825 [Staphylococcus epidermidis]|uniref:hypothetical protein n=1 Tax=Staphylococcus TaxID=1279 RepID=UPI00299B485C|nr:hypothetical protein [Staphylococcus aureus]HEH1999426.1 hypothetical protein [Staphylococcus aureus]